MKKLIYSVACLFLVSLVQAQGNTGDFGIGVVVGDATGPTFKYFTGRNTALDVGLGFSSDFKVYADYTWHSWDLIPRPESGLFGAYVGLGPRFEERDKKDDEFGVRTIVGMDYWLEKVPFELFFEGGPWFVMSPKTDTEFDVGIGARYYFQGKKKTP